jgi:hypothetical protein
METNRNTRPHWARRLSGYHFPRDICTRLDVMQARVADVKNAQLALRARRQKFLPASHEQLAIAVAGIRPWFGHPDWPVFVALLRRAAKAVRP